jgi:YVTN family beta-propeller protein
MFGEFINRFLEEISMRSKHGLFLIQLVLACSLVGAELPGPIDGGYLLPNGWRITPLGDSVETNDLVMNLSPTPDGLNMVALHSGYNPHGLVVIDGATNSAVQRIPLPTSWLGLAWHPDGDRLYVSGGNASRTRAKDPAPIYVFEYRSGRLSETPTSYLLESIAHDRIYWSGLVHHPTEDLLFAANKTDGNVVVFDTENGELLDRIPVEVNPYDLVLTKDGSTLYCSNWASDSVSVIDTGTLRVRATVRVGDNPNDIALSDDGRLFVACSNDNTVLVIDTAKHRVVETIVTSLYEQAPEGSTPNAVALDPAGQILYVANADNNNVCVVNVAEPGESVVMGFIPAGWYPSSVALDLDGKKLFVGNGKGLTSSSNIEGPHSPLRTSGNRYSDTTKTTVRGSVSILNTSEYRDKLRSLTKQVYANCPYHDDQLAEARIADTGPTIVPSMVGSASPIRHVIYIIK